MDPELTELWDAQRTLPFCEAMTGLIGKTELVNMFTQAAACVRSEHRRLTELDSIGGDGDHGTRCFALPNKWNLGSGSIEHRKPLGLS